jgi:hypothetical protein
MGGKRQSHTMADLTAADLKAAGRRRQRRETISSHGLRSRADATSRDKADDVPDPTLNTDSLGESRR